MVSLMEWATRRLIIVIVATGTVSVIGGVVIGRYAVPSQKSHGSDGASVTAQGGPSAAPSSAPTPGTTPTALVPTPAPSDNPPAAPAGSPVPGVPTRINELGIPVGYPHTQAGAISACANYVSAYGDAANREPSRLSKVFQSISETAAAKSLTQRLIDTNNQTAKNFGVPSVNSPQFRLMFRTLGFKVDSAVTDRAKVYIWSSATVGVTDGSPNYKPRVIWGTDLCTVTWNGEDWKLADADNGPDGPNPTEQSSDEFRRFVMSGVVG